METDKTPTVGAEVLPGAADSNPPVSGSEGQPPIEGEAERLLALLEGKLAGRIEELTKPYLSQLEGLKTVQGKIDRSQNTFAEQLAQFNKIKAATPGISDEQVLATMENQAKEGDWKTNIETTLKDLVSLVKGGGIASQQNNTVTSVFAKYGLDPKDPNVAPELLKQYKNAEEMELAALRTFHKLKTSPTPNAAQGAALNGTETTKRDGKKDISNIHDSGTLYDMAAEELNLK
jgi:hypothetical protein